MNIKKMDRYRITKGPFATKPGDRFGAFEVPAAWGKRNLFVLCSPFTGDWQHVSVSLKHRCPIWQEMCEIKDMFWGHDKWVVQYHPPENEYVNNHNYCLHLWRPKNGLNQTPPSLLVGVPGLDSRLIRR